MAAQVISFGRSHALSMSIHINKKSFYISFVFYLPLSAEIKSISIKEIIMQRIERISDLREAVKLLREGGKQVGLVPTMGALHEGHLSLVNTAKSNCDIVVVSTFVNPTQFNDPHDYKTYPRTPKEDAELLRSAGVDILFAPSEEEVYPEPDTRQFDLGNVGAVMEGPRRPGHFNGVCQIVSKLFDFVEPDLAFFGEKDFQQIAVIRRMLEITGQNVKIFPCPIVREADGLAKSSRNLLLKPEWRAIAPTIHKVMIESLTWKGILSPQATRNKVIEMLNATEYLRVEYYDIVDGRTLKSISTWAESKEPVGCITVYCGDIRLIDNIHY